MRIFGDALMRDPAGRFESGAAQHGTGTTKERRIPQIVRILDHAVEEFPFIGNTAKVGEIAFKRIGRIEMMRRLQHGEIGVAKKPSRCHLQE